MTAKIIYMSEFRARREAVPLLFVPMACALAWVAFWCGGR